MENLGESLAVVRERIGRAAARAGRDPAAITLLAVTKIFPAQAILDAWQLGLREFGENYVQEFEGKHPAVAGLAGARFHLIGHLQSNKARRAAELFHAIQTVDTARAGAAAGRGRPPAGHHAGGEALAGAGQRPAPRRTNCPPWPPPCAPARNLRLTRVDDHAAVVGGPGAFPPLFPAPAGTGLRAGVGAALHGHVARPGSGHRRRLHAGAGGYRVVRQEGEARVKVACYAPPRPARTGVADHAAALAGHLRTVGHGGSGRPGRGHLPLPPGQQPAPRRDLPARAGAARRGWCCTTPCCSTSSSAGSTKTPTWKSSFITTANGTAGWRARCGGGGRVSGAAARYFDYPMLRRVAERSRAVVVHNPAAARMVREHAPAARVVEIPLLYDDPPAPAGAAARFRQRLGIGPGRLRFRRVRIPAGVEARYLRAARLRRRAAGGARLRAAPGGGLRFQRPGTRRRPARCRSPGVVRLPYLDGSRLPAAAGSRRLRRSTCAIPPPGRPPPSPCGPWALGIPAMVTAGQENERYPESACLRVDPGPAERAALCDYMILAARFPDLAAGDRAGARRRTSPPTTARRSVAGLYWKVLCESCC